MAQAIYDDTIANSTAAQIQRRLAATQAASQATQVRAAANLPGSAAGINVTPISSQPAAITASDIAGTAANAATANPAGNVPGGDVPAYARRGNAAVATPTEVNPANLSSAERAGFARQGATFTDTPNIASPSAAPVAADAGEASRINAALAGRGAATIGSRVAGAASALNPVGNAALPLVAGASAVDSLGRDTSDYARRFGVSQPTSALGDIALRAGGVATDLGASILDVGTGAANLVRGAAGAAPLVPFSSIIQGQDNPAAAARLRQQQKAYDTGASPPLPATGAPNNADFGNVNPGANTAGAPVTSVAPNIAGLPTPVDAQGKPIPYGRVVNGVPTFSDGSGNPNSAGYVPRTMSQQDIAGLANGNRISIADAGIGGNIASEANGGRTLELGEGPTARKNTGFTAADRQAQGAAIEKQGNTYEFNRLMAKSQSELARGNKKTATILAGLAGNYGNKNAPDETPGATALNAAKVAEANANADNSRSEAGRRAQEQALIQQAQSEPDPNKRQTIYDTILAAQGKNSDRVISIKTRDPSGALDITGQPLMIERPFDARTRQYLDTAR